MLVSNVYANTEANKRTNDDPKFKYGLSTLESGLALKWTFDRQWFKGSHRATSRICVLMRVALRGCHSRNHLVR